MIELKRNGVPKAPFCPRSTFSFFYSDAGAATTHELRRFAENRES
jgi:hypothetical protein